MGRYSSCMLVCSGQKLGCLLSGILTTLQMSVTMMAATLMRHFCFEAIHPKSLVIPCGYDITVGSDATTTAHLYIF